MKIWVLVAAVLLSGCITETIEKGNEYDGHVDATNDALTNITVAGKVQKGRCWKDARVQVWPLINGTFDQTGQQFIEFTKNDGSFEIPAQVPKGTEYAFMYFKGYCDDEANGGSGYQELYSVRVLDGSTDNTNPLNKVAYLVARELLGADCLTVPECLALAETRTLDFLTMPEISEKFGEMDIQQNDSDGDRVLALANSMMLYGRTDAEAGDYMQEIATGVIQTDDTLRASIRAAYDSLPLYQIKQNLEASYASVDIAIDTPAFWRIHGPAYYTDLLERTPATVGEFNPGDSGGCACDAPYTTYAIPHRFESWVTAARYLAHNLSGGAVSVWTRGTHSDGYDAPGALLVTPEELREKLLDSTLPHHTQLGAHGLTAGTDYYFRIESGTAWALTTGCDGGFLPFGRKLASNDGGATWIGHDNDTTWFRKSGLSFRGVD